MAWALTKLYHDAGQTSTEYDDPTMRIRQNENFGASPRAVPSDRRGGWKSADADARNKLVGGIDF
jgi:hypothetical protein